MKQKRFYFEKFISDKYKYNDMFLIEVIAFIVKNGSHINEWYGKWDRGGVNRDMFRYSFNNEPYHAIELPLEYGNYISNLIDYNLLNFICRKQGVFTENYKRDALKFKKSNSFILVNDPDFLDYKHIVRFSDFNGKSLNYNPHAENCPNRKNAYIKKVKILLGCSIYFEFEFSFKMQGYEDSSWTERILRKKNETTSEYLNRCYKLMLSRIL